VEASFIGSCFFRTHGKSFERKVLFKLGLRKRLLRRKPRFRFKVVNRHFQNVFGPYVEVTHVVKDNLLPS